MQICITARKRNVKLLSGNTTGFDHWCLRFEWLGDQTVPGRWTPLILQVRA